MKSDVLESLNKDSQKIRQGIFYGLSGSTPNKSQSMTVVRSSTKFLPHLKFSYTHDFSDFV